MKKYYDYTKENLNSSLIRPIDKYNCAMYSKAIIMLTVTVVHMSVNYSKKETKYYNEVMNITFNCIFKF